jgi:hypothetical protein
MVWPNFYFRSYLLLCIIYFCCFVGRKKSIASVLRAPEGGGGGGKESFRELHQNHLESILSVRMSYETAICLTGSATYLLHFTTLEIYNFMGNAFTRFIYIYESAPRTLRLDHVAKLGGCRHRCLRKQTSDVDRMNKFV